MLIFDFYAGTGSATKAFEDRGHKIVKVELNPKFEADERNILTLSAEYLLEKYGRPDFIWASPPCTTFSVASIGHHWTLEKAPKTKEAEFGLALIAKTIALINELKPTVGYLIENPRGMLRKQAIMTMPRTTVTYCAYGDNRMKPTDIWGELPGWQARPTCKAGDPCHDAAPRGSTTGTQGIAGAIKRSMVPYQLSMEICDAAHKALDTPKVHA